MSPRLSVLFAVALLASGQNSTLSVELKDGEARHVAINKHATSTAAGSLLAWNRGKSVMSPDGNASELQYLIHDLVGKKS